MAETITIPSPSLFFRSPDAGPPARMPVKKSARRPQPAPTDTPKPSESNGVTKRKQSKSRNGMLSRLADAYRAIHDKLHSCRVLLKLC